LKLSKESSNRILTILKAALNLAVANRLMHSIAARQWGDVKQFAKATQRRTLFLDLRQRPKLVPHNACRREGPAGCFPELLTAPLQSVI
jgi:hypothetical protein